jgi:hypothetical protein
VLVHQNNDGVTRFEQGRPLWYFYGYKTDGIDPAGKVIKVGWGWELLLMIKQ